jgi:solute carrier family 25 (mitochondrial dicarboxylate transporter), member 10
MNAHGKEAGSALAIVNEALRTEGVKFMFRGWTPSFVRLCPQTVVTFVVLEQQKKWYRKLIGEQ